MRSVQVKNLDCVDKGFQLGDVAVEPRSKSNPLDVKARRAARERTNC